MGGVVEEWEANKIKLVDPGEDFYLIEIPKDGKGCIGYDARLDQNGDKQKSSCCLRTKKDYPHMGNKYWRLFWKGYANSEAAAITKAETIRKRILADKRSKGMDMGKN